MVSLFDHSGSRLIFDNGKSLRGEPMHNLGPESPVTRRMYPPENTKRNIRNLWRWVLRWFKSRSNCSFGSSLPLIRDLTGIGDARNPRSRRQTRHSATSKNQFGRQSRTMRRNLTPPLARPEPQCGFAIPDLFIGGAPS